MRTLCSRLYRAVITNTWGLVLCVNDGEWPQRILILEELGLVRGQVGTGCGNARIVKQMRTHRNSKFVGRQVIACFDLKHCLIC
jgi:hypothetical protein